MRASSSMLLLGICVAARSVAGDFTSSYRYGGGASVVPGDYADQSYSHPIVEPPSSRISFSSSSSDAIVWVPSLDELYDWLMGDVSTPRLHPIQTYIKPFFEWANEYNKEFDNLDDLAHGFENFVVSSDRIESHDAEEAGYTLGHNAYSHMSWEEFRNHFSIGKGVSDPIGGRGDFDYRKGAEAVEGRRLRGENATPDEVDWVKKGAVTMVKNQGSCGSCWSFSTTGSMEGAHFLKTGKLEVLSEQELVDCDSYDLGCNGGLMDYSFHWIQQNGGICTEEAYPYTAEDDICKKDTCEVVPGTGVEKWVDVPSDEEALMAAVAQQPVSIAIEADQMAFQLYSGGVLTATCGTNLDHGVLLVGYGEMDGTKYWKVKNSWGAEWGMDGYILLSREVPQHGGECGILMQASYPVLS